MENDRDRSAAEGYLVVIAPHKRGEVHLGDLERALASLHCRDGEHAKAIAACLGFGLKPEPKPPKEICDPLRNPQQTLQPQPPAHRQPVYVPPAPNPPPALPAHSSRSHLQALEKRAPTAPDINLDGETAMFKDEAEPTPVVRQSLFPEKTNRHILTASLATQRDGMEIDIAKLVAALCRRAHITHLPRRAEPTLQLGCQLLLDYSPGMVPFWEDLNGLISQVCDVVGPANTRVYSFDTRPIAAVSWSSAGQGEAWQPDGKPVLAATDFGIQGQYGLAVPDPSWAEAIERCAKAGTPVVILIPWPKTRWPANLGPTPALVDWSPHTTAAMLKRKLGIGQRISSSHGKV